MFHGKSAMFHGPRVVRIGAESRRIGPNRAQIGQITRLDRKRSADGLCSAFGAHMGALLERPI